MTIKLDMYNFILEGIRKEDARTGFFLQRFLQGPQEQWDANQEKAFEVFDLWDIVNVDDQYLQFLKNQVGWTADLEHITDLLTDDALRKLIDNSIAIWKDRGTEDVLSNLLFFATGTRNKIFNWFDYRLILGEAIYGEGMYISDSIEDGPPGDDENTILVKLVDSGSVSRELVKGLTGLMRPANETIQIVYHNFIDYFDRDGGDEQWTHLQGDPILVEDETMKLDLIGQAEDVITNDINAPGWTDYSARADVKFAGGSTGTISLVFNYVDSDNYYKGELDIAAQTCEMILVNGGSPSTIGATDLIDFGLPIFPHLYYELKAEAGLLPDELTLQTRVYLDGNLMASYDSPFFLAKYSGNMGFSHSSGVKMHIKGVENRPIPATFDTVL